MANLCQKYHCLQDGAMADPLQLLRAKRERRLYCLAVLLLVFQDQV